MMWLVFEAISLFVILDGNAFYHNHFFIVVLICELLGHILGNAAKMLKTSFPNMWTRYMHDECEALSLNTPSHQENTEQLRAPMISRESFWSPKVGVFRSMIFLFVFTNSLIYIVINYLFWETQWSFNPLLFCLIV
jgi:hypothetical protein